MYLWPGRRGLHHLVYPAEDPGEATSVYFALTLLVSALAVPVALAAWGWGVADESRGRPLPEAACAAVLFAVVRRSFEPTQV